MPEPRSFQYRDRCSKRDREERGNLQYLCDSIAVLCCSVPFQDFPGGYVGGFVERGGGH